MRINSRLLAAVCLSVVLAHAPVFAADSESRKQDAGKASNPSAESNGASASSSGEDPASAAAAKAGDDIDLRITVQPHRNGTKANKAVVATKPKFALPGVKNAHRRVFSASLAASREGRNAVSAPLAGPQIDLRRGNEQTSPAIRSPAIANTGGVGAPFGAAKPETVVRPVVPQSHVTVVVVPNTANHAISGTGLVHHGVNSGSALGGPAKTVAGINGTTVRPAH